MTAELRSQLERYTAAVVDQQAPITAVEAQALVGSIRELPEIARRDATQLRTRVVVAAAAAVAVLVLVGAVAWLSAVGPDEDFVDEPTTTIPAPVLPGAGGVLGPGSWSVAAAFPDGAASSESVAEAATELRTWPGVIEVAEVHDASEWLELTGLEAAACGNMGTGLPCGVGLVALVATPQMYLTQARLESELAMAAITATDVPVAFIEGLVAAARRTPTPELRFDTAALGIEVPLAGPDAAESGNLCAVLESRCLISVRVTEDDLVVQAGLVRNDGDAGLDVEVLGENGFGGSVVTITDFLIDGNGRGGVLAGLDGAAGDRAVHVLAGLPLDAAAVTFELADGTSVWQRPVAGMVLLVDRPGTASVDGDDGARATNRFSVVDASGTEIAHITGTHDGPIVIDVRVDPAEAGELPVAALGPIDIGDMTVSWTQARWVDGAGPSVRALVSTPAGFLGTDRQGTLWSSSDGATWNRDTPMSDLDSISVADAGSHILLSGTRTDGMSTMWLSEDGENWTEIDLSSVTTDKATRVIDATPSGLTWLSGPGGGVVVIIEDDRVVESYEPPWDTVSCCAPVDLIELNGRVVAFQADFNDSTVGVAYQYLGDGLWSTQVPVPISSHHAQLRDTALMFDHANAEVGSTPEQGLSQWVLLASNDGTTWSEVDTIEAKDVFGLQINAGNSFWIYGPLGGGGSDIERYRSSATLWLSRDGEIWEPIDISFTQQHSIISVVGDTIFIRGAGAGTDLSHYWIGTVRDL